MGASLLITTLSENANQITWQQYYGKILNAYEKINFGLYHNKLIFPLKKHAHVLNLTVEIFCFHPINPKKLITCCFSTLYKPFRKVFLYTLQTLQEISSILNIPFRKMSSTLYSPFRKMSSHTIHTGDSGKYLPHFIHHSGKCLLILYTLFRKIRISQSSVGDYTSICF